MKPHLEDAVAQIRVNRDYRALRGKLARELAELERVDDGRAKALAIRGLREAVKGLDAQVEFVENDRGNLPVALEDAKRADRHWRRAAGLLRAAGDEVGLEIGLLNGY